MCDGFRARRVENNGLWFRDPMAFSSTSSLPNRNRKHVPPSRSNNPGTEYLRKGRRGAPNRNIDTRPRKLGHILKFTTDINRDAKFYTEVLGMKLSDRIGDELAAFLRCGGDSDHHTLAMATSEASGLHHMSWEMGNVDQLQMCAERLLKAGYKDGWGMGRHIYGSNYFHYIRDPWMGLNEFFWDIDFIPENAEWKSRKPKPTRNPCSSGRPRLRRKISSRTTKPWRPDALAILEELSKRKTPHHAGFCFKRL